MSTSERQRRWDGLERKHERQDWAGLDMYGGNMMSIQLLRGDGCGGWNCPERGNGECLKGGFWIQWERTLQCLKWRMRMQNIGPNGDGKSAVESPDGRSRNKIGRIGWENSIYRMWFMQPETCTCGEHTGAINYRDAETEEERRQEVLNKLGIIKIRQHRCKHVIRHAPLHNHTHNYNNNNISDKNCHSYYSISL